MDSRWKKRKSANISGDHCVSTIAAKRVMQPSEMKLPEDPEALKALVLEMSEVIAAQKHRIADLSRRLFGRMSERRTGDAPTGNELPQGYLFHDALIAEAERTALAKQVQGDIEVFPPKKRKKAGGRRPRFLGSPADC